MSTVDKLVYLIQQGVVSIERVAEQYRNAVGERLRRTEDEA